MNIFWLILSILNLIWWKFYFKQQPITEENLVKISREFDGVTSGNIRFLVVWFSLFSIFSVFGLYSSTETWAQINYGSEFYPLFVFMFCGVAIHRGVLAIAKGILPVGVIHFIYEDEI